MDIEKKQKMLKEYEIEMSKKTLKELEKIESKLIAEADANENYEVVANAIRMFLNKETVQWQYTLALVGLYDFWDPKKEPTKIPYAHLDAILRKLGQMQFTGYDEWAAVVAVNKYFEPLHNAYVDATEKTYDIASKHQIVMDAMDKIKNSPTSTTTSPEVN